MTTPLVLPSRTRTLVQIATTWPTNDAGWTSIDAWCQNASIGANNDMGSASLYSPSGTLYKPGASVSSLVKSQAIVGKYARVLNQDLTGTVADTDGVLFNPLWHGLINSRKIASDNEAFVNSYSAAGIMAALDSVTPQYHLMEDSAGLVGVDIGACPVFNYLGSKKTGNRSADKYDIGRGVEAYVFSRLTDATFWTAQDVVEYWLALFAYFAEAGPIFSLAGQLTALEWREKWDLKGHTCGEAVSRVMSQKQGIAYRCAVDPSTRQPVITIKSCSKVAITVPPTPFMPEAFVLPANDEQTVVDLTGDDHIQGFEITEDGSSTADELAVTSSRAWYAVTLSLFDHFIADWVYADQVIYDEWQNSKIQTYGTLNTNFGVARVYRRYKLAPGWNGEVVGGFVIPNHRSVESSSLHGTNGFNGVQTDVPADQRPSPRAFVMTSDLPCLDGYDWATVDPATVDKTRRNAPAMAFEEMSLGGHWGTLAYAMKGDYSSISIEVDADLGAITFPEEAAEELKYAAANGRKIYITVGVYAQMEDIVSWRRAAIERARDQSRTFNKARPALMRKIIPSGTVVGVTEAGVLITTATEKIIHDDTALSKSVLAISTPWFKENAWGVTYTKKGEIDPTYALPGAMLTEIDHFEGDGTVTEEAVVGVVTNLQWNFAEPGETIVTSKRVQIDVEPVI